MPIAEINDFKMHYEIVENVVPHDTLFVHGNTGSNRWWIPVLQSLRSRAKPGYKGRAIFAEWRGCGESSAPNDASELQLPVLASDYVALLEKLNVTSASIVGHSLGGLIGLYAVAEKPSLFRRILLVNSVGPKGIPYDDSAYDYFERIPSSRENCAQALSFSFYGHRVDPTLFDRLVDDAMKMAPLNWKVIWRMLSRFDARDVISKIMQPTLVVHGQADKVLALDEARSLMATLPNAELFTIKNHGHSPYIESPEEFTSLLAAFLYNAGPVSETFKKDQENESRDDNRHRPVRARDGRSELIL